MNGVRWWAGSLVAMAALAAASGLWAEEAKLAFNPDSLALDPGEACVPRSRSLEGLAAPATPLKGQPKLVSANPRFFELKLGPDQAAYAFILDESNGTGQGYDRLYVDAQASGNLADAKPLGGQCQREGNQTGCLFKDCQVLIRYGGETAPWRFDAFASTSTPPGQAKPETALVVCPFGYYGGTVQLDGRAVKVALVDAGCSGRYDEPLDLKRLVLTRDGAADHPGSRILLDLDGGGRFRTSGPGAFPCTKYIQLNGSYYAVTVAANGQRLGLAKAEVPQGTIEREGGGRLALSLVSPECGLVTVQSGVEPVRLPAGRYKLLLCGLAVSRKDGTLWQAGGRGTDQGAEIVVAANAPTRLKIGPPLVVGVTANVAPPGRLDGLRPNEELSLGITLRGQAGETYPTSVLRQGAGAVPPTLRITAADGRVVQQGSFSFG